MNRRIPLHTKIFAGLVAGAILGTSTNLLWGGSLGVDWAVRYLAQPVGQVFLRMLFMVVVPLIFTSLGLGVTGIGDVRKPGGIRGSPGPPPSSGVTRERLAPEAPGLGKIRIDGVESVKQCYR